ncbi:MAG TPA: efflux RND transporter periplasmic adaptor subunit [Roseiarcus sp.]|jgi:multidrug efflux system membrane fusion protein
MGFRGFFRLLIVVVVAGCLYSVYAPETAEKLAPAAGAYARKLHDLLPAAVRSGETKTAAAAPEPQPPKGPPPPLVSVAEARRADYPVYLESLGQAQAYNTVTVRTRVDGQVMKIAFVEGQIVRAGDLLAQIDPRPFQATLDQAKAKKSQDEANLANAKLDQQRYSTLAKQSFATQQQLDTQNALVAQLTAAIAADSATIDAAEVQLAYTTIRAPITGRTGFRLIDEGNMVAATQQTGIVTIAQLQPIAVIFTAPEGEVTKINATLAAGAPLQVLARDSSGEKTLASGHLLLADNQVDVATGTIRLKAEFANEDNALWPGLAVSTRLTIGEVKDAVTVPTVAVQHGPNGLFVYVIDDKNRAAMRPVTVTHQNTEIAVVDKGVSAGDRVVTVGQYVLQPGTLVAIDTAANTGS